jgi:hypothetical protein
MPSVENLIRLSIIYATLPLELYSETYLRLKTEILSRQLPAKPYELHNTRN